MARAASRGGAEPSDADAWLAELISEESASALSHGSRTTALSLGRETIERKAADLVRLALFTEYKRHPLRREEVMKKLIGKDASRAFPVIFAYAQSLLRKTFAFELVELRARNQENPLLLEMAEALDEPN
ncbi:hypothetical protein MBRA1_001983 [Malassezia brasiliensis]|uniref:MAGE domain-containing protein n=1 Tax=Malassezia brasiliensis TaxID=1821822 RepID=A0AAF0DV31_9BASI|nr:hypothetical protein MBRA1_001983 [Malassezia brasiliensis]